MNKINIVSIVVIITLIIIGIAVCLAFYLLYRSYLRQRLKGEGKIRKFPQPLMLILVIFLTVSLVSNIILAINIATQRNESNRIVQKLEPNHIIITDFSNSVEYSELRNALINETLAGYEISRKSQGDFECIIARPTGKINGLPFMPQYFIYINYIGEVLDDFQMKRYYYYDEEEHGSGSTGKFKPETLIIGNTFESNFYIGIRTIIKIAPETSETKKNWDSIPVYKESYFKIGSTTDVN